MNEALASYLRETGMTQTAFAKRGGWRNATVSAWMNGTIPDPANIAKVAEITDGAVPVSSWFPRDAQKAAS